MLGQVVYHLLSAAHAVRAPWPVVVLVSCLPVVTLGFGGALAHMLRDSDGVSEDTEDVTLAVPAAVPNPTGPSQWLGVLHAGRPTHARKAERKYAGDLAEAGAVASVCHE